MLLLAILCLKKQIQREHDEQYQLPLVVDSSFRTGKGATFLSQKRIILVDKEEVISLKVSVAQSCLTFCDPMDYSSLGSSIHGILQARILEWIAIPFSKGSF